MLRCCLNDDQKSKKVRIFREKTEKFKEKEEKTKFRALKKKSACKKMTPDFKT